MAKTVRDSKLDSPAARARLKPAGKPYYRSLDTGLHLGYRKGKNGGRWVARFYLGDEKYAVETIAASDDGQAADGNLILNFSQAQSKARDLAAARRAPALPSGPLTVGQALDRYLERQKAEHKKSLVDTKSRIETHIRPTIGIVAVDELTRDKISAWLNGIASQSRQVRGKKGSSPRALAAPTNDEQRRRRKATANRTLTVLRAALNQAFADGETASDAAWRAVKPFREVEQARVRYFTTDEVRRLINAAQGSFRALVHAALFTGCRYGELCRLRVGDFNPDSGTVFVAQSKSGKARHVVLTDEGQELFAQLVAGRATDELLLTREDGGPWGASHQTRFMIEACRVAKIAQAGFHILRHTAASHNVMGGVPMPVVAQNLGHADTRMTEKHYAHLAPSYVAETLRKFAPTFGTVERTKVVPIAGARS